MESRSNGAQSAISLPQGGGAIQGIGETFQANLSNGTANHSVPIALSPGRNGFGPQLALEYSSGAGNGVFGLGWQLSLPRITRKTEKGLPRYDHDDVFVMSGAEDLVRTLKKVVDPENGAVTWAPLDPAVRGDFSVFFYRPRTEGLFARIERWVHNGNGGTHWRTISKDNLTSVFGATAQSRLSDPVDEQRIYEWLLQETFDAFGNQCRYEYAADAAEIEPRRAAIQRYIRRIYYGNLPVGVEVGPLREGRRYAFEAVFDYGDLEVSQSLPHPEPPPAEQLESFGPLVPVRPDRFSSFRSGFEIRTLRRCRRVLMFHHFAELGGPTLVRSTDLTYGTDPDAQLSLLKSVTVTGYDRSDTPDGYQSASMPPVVFSYAEFKPNEQRYQTLTALGRQMPSLGLGDPNMALVDLFGDGLPDILHTGPGGFCYWRNLGNGT